MTKGGKGTGSPKGAKLPPGSQSAANRGKSLMGTTSGKPRGSRMKGC